jgi:CubicO group peptidase (beta-lactamase class C family)
MTVHVSVRSISALLLLSVSLLGLPADALAQSVVAPQKAAPTLAERLDRLGTEFDRIRIDLHVRAYLAAGLAAGVAAGTSWHALMKERILAPRGMTATRTSFREGRNDPRTARGYWWDEAGQRIRPPTLETMGYDIDGIAPAGAISSTARDMTSWVRFLLQLAPDTFMLQPSTESGRGR